MYAVTPRFALSTSDAMLDMCQTLLREHRELRVQSHINESPDEVRMVAEQFRWGADYVSVYDRFGLTASRAVLAHNVHPTESELERLAASGTAIAHCPTSNAALGGRDGSGSDRGSMPGGRRVTPRTRRGVTVTNAGQSPSRQLRSRLHENKDSDHPPHLASPNSWV